MTETERTVLRLSLLGVVALMIALLPWLRRRLHPVHWAEDLAHDVVDPAQHLLGLDEHAHGPGDLLADAALAAVGIVEGRHHHAD